MQRFQVSDKFAGKAGPCPKCKRVIRVPTLAEQVQIQEPQEFASGGRDSAGKLAAEPILRTETKIAPVATAIIVAVSVVVVAVAWIGGKTGLFQSYIATSLGLLLVSPPLVLAIYSVFHNDELEPYRGKSLYLRSMICAAAYVILWGIFALLAHRGLITGDLWVWVFLIPPFLIMGGLTALATFDLDFGDAMFHYACYLVVILMLRWAAGMKWAWDLSR